jgi:hypothetical protein
VGPAGATCFSPETQREVSFFFLSLMLAAMTSFFAGGKYKKVQNGKGGEKRGRKRNEVILTSNTFLIMDKS